MGRLRKWRRIYLLSMSHWFSLRSARLISRASLQSNSMIFAALTTGKIAQVSFLATTPGRSSFLLDRESALKASTLT